MKKSAIILLILILLTTASCAQNNSTDTLTTTTDREDQQSSIQSPMVEVPLVTIESYEEYCNFIENTQLPNDFIYYSQVEVFGEFDIYIGYQQDGYSHGLYQLIDENGFEISIYVDSRRSEWKTSDSLSLKSFSSSTASDLRSVGDSADYMIGDNLIYSYVQGNLHSIIWYAENNEFCLCGGLEQLGNYPVESKANTMVQGLLHSSTAQSTLSSITENASSSRPTAEKQ